jgi:hypothetical protein
VCPLTSKLAACSSLFQLLKNIESKLTLSEEEHVHLMLYGDSQKVMEGFEILHGEFPLEGDMVCCTSVALDSVRALSST